MPGVEGPSGKLPQHWLFGMRNRFRQPLPHAASFAREVGAPTGMRLFSSASVKLRQHSIRSQKSVYSLKVNSAAPVRTASRHALIAVGAFLVFGACMAALAGTTLLWPGTVLDRVWALNKPAYRQLSPAGSSVGALFFAERDTRDCFCRLVQTPSLGMAIGSRRHFHAGCRRLDYPSKG